MTGFIWAVLLLYIESAGKPEMTSLICLLPERTGWNGWRPSGPLSLSLESLILQEPSDFCKWQPVFKILKKKKKAYKVSQGLDWEVPGHPFTLILFEESKSLGRSRFKGWTTTAWWKEQCVWTGVREIVGDSLGRQLFHVFLLCAMGALLSIPFLF